MFFGIYIGTWWYLCGALCAFSAMALLQSVEQENGKWPKTVMFLLCANLFGFGWNVAGFAYHQIQTAEIRYAKDLTIQALEMEQEELRDEGISD
jgi:hypothetical protein